MIAWEKADAKSMKQSYDLEIELFKNVQNEAPTLMSTVTYNNDAGRSPYLVLTCCPTDQRSGGGYL